MVIQFDHSLLVENTQQLSGLRSVTLVPLLEPACGADPWIALTLDLRVVRELNSLGLSLLFEIVRSVAKRGGSCGLILGSERVMRVARFARLTSMARVSMVSPAELGLASGSKVESNRRPKPGFARAARLAGQPSGGR